MVPNSVKDNPLAYIKGNYLFHMTHISNLKSILTQGLLSHNQAQKYRPTDISNKEVNIRRSYIHEYVPLYFNPRNPMLYYNYIKHPDKYKNTIIFAIHKTILDNPQVIFTDGNAASAKTNIYKDITALHKLNWNIIYGRYWNHQDEELHRENKRLIMAEVLIPYKINCTDIKVIIIDNPDLSQTIGNYLNHFPKNTTIPTIKRVDLFFDNSNCTSNSDFLKIYFG